MKIKSMAVVAALGAVLFVPVPRAEGRDLVSIRRVRTIPNPAPDKVPGEEVLEVTFSLDTPGWAGGMGWCLKYYGPDKGLRGEETEAYIDPARNPMSRIRDRRFKGQTVFTLLFPLREGAEYTVLLLGNVISSSVILHPYTALLEDFNVPTGELNAALARSRLTVLEN